MLRVIGVLMGLALVLGGCAGASAGTATPAGAPTRASVGRSTHMPPPPPLPAAAHTEVVGGTGTQRALMRAVLRAFGPSEVKRVAISSAAAEPRAPSGSVQITLRTVAGPDRTQQNLAAEWECWVLGAAFRDRSRALGLPLVFYEISPEGANRIGDRASPKPYAGPSLAHVRSELRAAVDRSGARLVTFQVGQPLGVAAIVRIQTDRRAAWFMARRLTQLVAATADRFRYDGLYLVLYDRAGRPIFDMANGTRMAIGADGVPVKRLAGCNPLTNLGVYQPPPCPVT